MKLNPTELQQLSNLGIDEAQVSLQLEIFEKGIAPVNLTAAATFNNGLRQVKEEDQLHWIAYFNTHKKQYKLLKFVPASGAASRMFKNLFAFLEQMNPEEESFEDYLNRTNDEFLRLFSKQIEAFPFYAQIETQLKQKQQPFTIYNFVSELLLGEASSFGQKPKGVLPFHLYDNIPCTPVEEHLLEGIGYSCSNGKVPLHFTVSPAHQPMFEAILEDKIEKISQDNQVEFEVDFSFQKSSTDTIAVNMDNSPFKLEDDSLLFRPSGHGALIENLNEIDADIVFIKNIDNVALQQHLNTITQSKQMLAGILMYIQSHIFEFCVELQAEVTEDKLEEIINFLDKEVRSFKNLDQLAALPLKEKQAELLQLLNRPIRVCGMVKNEGAPGGGPFWIKDNKGQESLQIIETAQINQQNEAQKAILEAATHFNPVDLVCGIKDFQGNKFNLLDFVDPDQGFITEKTKDGKKLKALERPGLWNGAMADWITIFVEVPLITFNPVKTVNDLLKPAHNDN